MGIITIADRKVGGGYPTLVIAEIGVNHDGSLKRALELVEYADDAGADAVKLQVFRASSLVHATCQLAEYQKGRVQTCQPQEMLRRYELYPDELEQIVKEIRGRGMIPLATPFSPGDLATIKRLDPPAIKIASPDLVNWVLLSQAAALGRPLLLSTGAATMDEVRTTISWLREWKSQFALLHCVSSYPVASKKANLCWIAELAQFDVPVGYSDHTTEELAGALAVAATTMVYSMAP
jgi:sialic acid synthase SpsE